MIAAIIQARNGNDRLPGKGSIELLGKPMLQHVIERVKRAKRIDEIIVAIPGAPEDNILLAVAQNLIVKSFCGRHYDIDDADLAKRYFICARQFQADTIIRICADNPCIEPEAIDLLIEHGNLGAKGALVTNAGDYRVADRDLGWPDGIGAELYTMEMLEFLNFEISKPLLREHPHKYYHDTHNIVVPPCPEKWRRPGLRLDVNTQEDYEYIQMIYNYMGDNEFHIDELLGLFALQEHWTKRH
jgi:spore coat polysaccharide biosynthesis protein SpsF